MQFSVEKIQGLIHRAKIIIKINLVESFLKKQLLEFQKKFSTNGFRKGKVPIKIIQEKYGNQISSNAYKELMCLYFEKLITQEKIKLASVLVYTKEYDDNKKNFQYCVDYEIYPTLNINFQKTAKHFTICEPVVCVQKNDINQKVQQIRKLYATWSASESLINIGDRITASIHTSLPITESSRLDYDIQQLELKENCFLPGFAEALYGKKPTTNLKFFLTLPKNYQVASLQNKKVLFTVNIKKLEKPTLPEVNSDFFYLLGIKESSIEGLHSAILHHTKREIQSITNWELKNQIVLNLQKHFDIVVPKTLVVKEKQILLAQLKQNSSNVDKNLNHHLQEQANKNVLSRILFKQIITDYNIKIDTKLLSQTISQLASNHKNTKDFLQDCKKNKNIFAVIQDSVLEQQAVDVILQETKISKKSMNLQELLQNHKKLNSIESLF